MASAWCGADGGGGSLNMTDMSMGQGKGPDSLLGLNFLSVETGWPADADLLVYFISGWPIPTATPFDVVEGRMEIVCGPHDRVFGHELRDVLLAEYANMWLAVQPG